MNRDELLNLICDVYPCVDSNLFFNKWLDEYDKQIRAKAIEQYKNALLKLIKDEQYTRYGYLNEMDIREVADQVINE